MAELVMNFAIDGLAPGLSGLADRLSDLSPALSRAGELMKVSVTENFAAQGRPQRWEALKPETVERKGHDTVLSETGRLMDSISCRASVDRLSITAGVPYAQLLQYGTGSTGLPARPFLIFQDADIQAIGSVVESYIAHG